MTIREIYHAHLFGGIGGGADGFNQGHARVGRVEARFVCLGSIDVDEGACRNFTRNVGTRATCMDLFDRAQYVAFHGREPPEGWCEAVPADLHAAFQNKRPHIFFLSAPCKGFSGLLSEIMSANAKYQALNRLTLRGVWLALEAYKDDPVDLYVFENVPRIATRGRPLVDRIVALFRAYGYAATEGFHNCGELGNLGQSRKRFLLVARHQAKVPNFLYQPDRHPLRGIGEIIGKLPLPLPGIEAWNPMHRMPSLQWKTWVRLAFVRAGADWRSLNELAVADGVLRDFGIAADLHMIREDGRNRPYNGAYGVRDWGMPAGTVSTQSLPSNGSFSVADPRLDSEPHGGCLGVKPWEGEPSCTVAGRSWPHNNAFTVADPRVDGHPKSVQLGVRPWGQTAGVVTGKMFAGGGPHAVADPRIYAPASRTSLDDAGGRPRFNNAFRIVRWADFAPAVAGPGSGAAVADPRAATAWNGKSKYRVTRFEDASGTVLSASSTGQGAFAVADPRAAEARHHSLRVGAWEKHGGTITASRSPGSGALTVADPRTGYGPHAHRNKLAVAKWGEHGGTVTGSDRVGSGALSVADPRPAALNGAHRDGYATQGYYGVVDWHEYTGAIPASAQHDNGRWSVADPRSPHGAERNAGPDDASLPDCAPLHPGYDLPATSERLVCVIRALDDTWHRPLTTLELAALQGLVDPDDPRFHLDATSDSTCREWIGNCVPPPSARAIASVMGRTLLAAWGGETFMLSSEPIWVQPIAIALMAAQGEGT